MTELDLRRDSNDVAITSAPERLPETPSALLLWAHEARQAVQIAQSLVKTSFVPASLKTVDNVVAAILAGQELGLKPMASLRSMDIIQGTPALRAHAMRGLIQSHGHKVVLVESTPARCVMRGLRLGDTDWQTVEWTIERAARLELTGKGEWKKQPQTMLVARATGEICRLIASDVLFAMPYAAEELRGDPDTAAEAGASWVRVTAEEIVGRQAEAPELDAAPNHTVNRLYAHVGHAGGADFDETCAGCIDESADVDRAASDGAS